MKRYFTIWYKSMTAQAQIAFASRVGVVLFTLGKLLRFSFFLIFLILIGARTTEVGGYTIWEMIFFFATFNLIDTAPQMMLRSVYSFRRLVVSGDFDIFFLQPISALFRALLGGSDIIDLPILILIIGFIIYSGWHLPYFSVVGIFIYILLVLNAFIIAIAFHILVLSIGIVSTEVDNTIMLYRDLTQMGRVPVSIYQQGVSFILTFVVPVGIMMTFPVQALLGTLSLQFILYSLAIGIGFLIFSLFIWRGAIKHYTSASS
jgi:ABC-2 type transport system permease protein